MNSLITLNEADEARLHSILSRTAPPPFPDPGKEMILRKILESARIGTSEIELTRCVGFYDFVTLVSPTDSMDFFKFQIVMPHETDTDKDRVSIYTPIAASALGRSIGDLIQWITPHGPREMRLIAFRKCDTSILLPDTMASSFS